jgi:hypothetical protein
MDSDGAGAFWLIAVVGGPILLGLALLFGIAKWRTRRLQAERIGEEITRDNYAAEARREKRQERESA